MISARTRWAGPGASVDGVVFVGDGVRGQAVQTTGLVFDARFAAPVEGRFATGHLFVLLDGWLTIGDAAPIAGPVWFCASRGEFEARSPGALAFRLGGEPRRSLELTVDPDRLAVPVGLAHGAHPVSPALVAAARQLLDAEAGDRVARCREVVAVMVAEGRLAPAPLSAIDPGGQRLLDALSRLYESHDTSAYAELVSSLTGRSIRQLSRDMAALARTSLLPGTTLRELFRVLRLRRAALLLSAPQLSIDAVAHAVGYGSTDALSRAFRDVGFPPPSEVRAALR